MRLILTLSTAVALSLAGYSSLSSAAEPQAEEHSHDHSAQAPAKVDASRIDQQMKKMQEMHQKTLPAKTPEQRAPLMKEHMKVMQDAMVMMGQMHAGGLLRGSVWVRR